MEAPIKCTADRPTRKVGNFAPALLGIFDPAFSHGQKKAGTRPAELEAVTSAQVRTDR